jgi:hypothetical protein
MEGSMEIFDIVIISTAMWRVASLISNEMGPWHMLKRFRHYCGTLCEKHRFWRNFHLYELITCEWCNTVWMGLVAVPLYLLFGKLVVWLALPFALSAYAIFIKLIVNILQELCRYLVKARKSLKRKEVSNYAVEDR